MKKSLKLHQTDQACDCYNWCLFQNLYPSIHGSNGNPQIMTEASCLSFPRKGKNWYVTEHI